MSIVFDINRFRKLEKRNFFLSKMHYLYIIGGLIGVYLLSMLMYMLTGNSLSTLIDLSIAVLIIGAPCFFEQSINKHTGVFEFILPVSTFERYLSIWLKYVIIMPTLMIIVIFLLNVVTGIIPIDTIKAHADIMSLNDSLLKFKNLHVIITLQAVFITGFLYFRKYAFAKTSLILLLIFVILLFVGALVSYFILKSKSNLMEESVSRSGSFQMGYTFGRSLSIRSLSTDHPLIQVADTILDIVLLPGFWVVSYFKLRETEI